MNETDSYTISVLSSAYSRVTVFTSSLIMNPNGDLTSTTSYFPSGSSLILALPDLSVIKVATLSPLE